MMIDISRLSNLLNPAAQQQASPTFPQQNNPMIGQDMFGGGDDQLMQALMSLLNPKDEQYDRFAQLISSIPQRQNYQPGKMRKVGAFLAGLGSGEAQGISGGQPIGYKSNIPEGLKIQSSILDQPYNQALKDWGTQAEPTLEAAKLEGSRNTANRQIGSTILTSEKNRRELERKEARDTQIKSKEDSETARKSEDTKIRKQRADAYVYKTMHPNHKFIETNGYIYSVDPVSNATEQLKDSDGDPIESGKLGDADKANLQLTNAKELENLRQGNRKELENTRQDNRIETEQAREVNRQKDITSRAANRASASPKNETPAAKKVRLFNRAIEGINKNPAWKDYISIDKAHSIFRVDTPESKTGFFGLGAKQGGDPKIAQEIVKYIYGDEKPDNSTTNSAASPTIPDSEARVIITNGQKNFSLPSSQVDAYLKLHPEFKRK